MKQNTNRTKLRLSIYRIKWKNFSIKIIVVQSILKVLPYNIVIANNHHTARIDCT